MMKRLSLVVGMVSSLAWAEESLPIKVGGFIDTYYAYDFNDPASHEREFTTQPVRHNEFNINLAYIEAVVKQEKTRGRLALQYGNSVIKNTVGEPRDGATSGPDIARMFQEAYVGKKINEKTWIDAGIFLGNIGAESWISKDNWTYSRSLNLDYVPYYSSGIRIEHFLHSNESVQVQVLNGWQNMSENNGAKALGFQYKNIVSEKFTFTYNNFLGDEEVVPNPITGKYHSRYRGYHNFIFLWNQNESWQYLSAVDFGHQSQQTHSGVDGWFATTLTIHHVMNQEQSGAFRLEYYDDPHQANVSTGTPRGFQVVGGSINFDQKLDSNCLWRTELRAFNSKDKIYPQGAHWKSRNDGYLVTSLSIWF